MVRPVPAGVLACALTFMTGYPVAADDVLPPFTVAAPDGSAISSTSLVQQGRWLLVYVVPRTAASDQVVERLASWFPAGLQHVVLIVGADVEAARAYLRDKGGAALAERGWYADPDRGAWIALRLDGTIAVAGISGETVDWRLQGVITEAASVEPTARAWLNNPD